MDLIEKIRLLPTQPGVYLYKNADGVVIYVGKAKNLRSRVRSYLLEASQANAKTGSLMREAVDIDYILVANEHEALALENNLIKQRKPRFNILLRDDKTYPYVKLTLADRYPKVFVTRRLRKDGSAYYGPYFPGNLAYRVVELIHRSFLIPSCKVDLSRYHQRACLQYYIHRCLGPCVQELTTPEIYRQAVRDAQLFLEGRQSELERSLTARMHAAAEAEQYEAAARLRDQLSTVHQLQEKQRIATAEQSDDADVFGYHLEDDALAVNLFHVRNGKIVDRREFFFEDLHELMEAVAAAESSSTEDLGAPRPGSPQTGLRSRGEDLASETWETTEADEKHVLKERYFSRAEERHEASGHDSGNPQRGSRAEENHEASGHDSGNPQRGSRAEEKHEASGHDFSRADDQQKEGASAPEGIFNPGVVFSALLKQLYIDQQYVPRSILVPVDFDDRESLATLLGERIGHRVEIAVPQRGEKRSLIDLAGQNAKQSFIQRFRVLEPSRKAIQESLADSLMLPELPRRIECFDISHIQGAETVASMVVWEDGKMNKSAYRKFKVMTVLGVDDFASMREVVTRRYKRILENTKTASPQPMGAPSMTKSWVGDHESQPASKGHDFSAAEEKHEASGHDFSRAANGQQNERALAPEGKPGKEEISGAPSITKSWVGDHESHPVLKEHNFSHAEEKHELSEHNFNPAEGKHEASEHDFSRAAKGQQNEGALAPEEKTKEPATMPSLILIDGGLGQLHAAADALESLGFTSQPLASIAKKEEVIYLYGNEDEPVVLDRRSPVLHLVQMIRDESHRFAVGYHRQRRAMRDRDSELLNIPGVGRQTRQRLLTHFGSLRDVQQATADSLASVVPRKTAESIWRHFHESKATETAKDMPT
jgi:excinuclease ABC subunit C